MDANFRRKMGREMSLECGRGELFVVSAPSGAGKTTLCRAVCERIQGLEYSISHTTRPPRPTEIEGRDYFFVSEVVFQKMVQQGEFLEWASVYQYRYGTSRTWVERCLTEGLDVILDVDTQGAERLRSCGLPIHRIFVLPPSWEALKARLVSRGTDAFQEIEKRLLWAQGELRGWKRFDFIILNDELGRAIRDLEAIILAQRCRTNRRGLWIETHLQLWTPSSG
jgi:guanylate kinase